MAACHATFMLTFGFSPNAVRYPAEVPMKSRFKIPPTPQACFHSDFSVTAKSKSYMRFTSLGLQVPVCLPILCRLWEQARRWGRCLCFLPSDWAGWLGGACAAQRQLYQETGGHGGGGLIKSGTRENKH